MKRLRRIAWNGLGAALALLCVATVMMWVRSYAMEDDLGSVGWRDQRAGIWGGRGIIFYAGTMTAYSSHGTLVFDDLHGVPATSYATMQPHLLHHVRPVSATRSRRNSFRWETSSFGGSLLSVTFVGLPLWLPAVAFAIMPVWYGVVVLQRARRPIPGICSFCSYDLRATPDRCPECGTAVEKRSDTRVALGS